METKDAKTRLKTKQRTKKKICIGISFFSYTHCYKYRKIINIIRKIKKSKKALKRLAFILQLNQMGYL